MSSVQASKFLSLILRHQPEIVGITLDPQGWVDVEVLLAATGQKLNRAMLLQVVAENNKKRFEFSEDGLRLRASQGHSIPVELGYEPQEPPDVLYHGTPISALPAIRVGGLLKMDRHDVHLSVDEATAQTVGSRRGKCVILEVYAGQMHHDKPGTFRMSTNGVWLSEHVPADYINFPCSECCTMVGDKYMVHDELWTSSGTQANEVLHIACLENRLGRRLVKADFKDVPINTISGFLP